MLLGRRDERARIEQLLDTARHGRSGVLVVRGEPGIGKTTLLRHAASAAEGMTVLSATGVPSEAELEYSGLVELVRPVLALVVRLPEHQAAALREALGLAHPGDRRDRFAVGAALLSLCAAAADPRPLLVLVDDVQWLDHASADALRFAARRMLVDRVAFIVALRDGEASEFGGAGFDELVVRGLDLDDVAALVGRSHDAVPPRQAVERVHGATGGNPLAVIELAQMVSPVELLRRFDEQEPMPVGPAIQRAFARRSRDLPEATRRALLLAAVATVPDIDAVGRALTGLGLELRVLEPAEDAGLVSLDGGGVAFRHPLVRSAIHGAATPSERRSAHRALAEALSAGGEEDRRAWHLAGAALGPDESIASSLAAVAARSRIRGGHMAAAAALEHAARLTPDPATRADRLARAASAAWAGGVPTTAIALVEEALAGCSDPIRRSRLLSLRGRIEREVGAPSVVCDLLLEAARLVEPHDPAEAASTLLYAMPSIFQCGDLDGALRVAQRAYGLVPHDGGMLAARAGVSLGWALFHTGRGGEGVAPLEQAVAALAAGRPSRVAMHRAIVALELLERVSESAALARGATDLARGDGPAALSYALAQAARIDIRSGDWQRAVASGEEGLALGREIGDVTDVSGVLLLLARVDAARGDEERCRGRLDTVVELATSHGMKIVPLEAQTVLGLLELGLGRHDAAAETLIRVASALGQLGLFERDITPEPDLIEALLGLGRAGEARDWVEAYESRGARASPRWGAALVARGRGLLAEDDDEATRQFSRALELHRAVPDRFQEARTLLFFGERLRRVGSKVEARDRLRQALAGFDALDARPWAERARGELRATGETIRRARHRLGDELTPQELQVALQVAEGKTNKEAAAALFLSPKTIEFHLARVYPKLGVRSRAELIKRVTTEGAGALVPT